MPSPPYDCIVWIHRLKGRLACSALRLQYHTTSSLTLLQMMPPNTSSVKLEPH